jgi:hypothetical protein
LQEQFDGLGGTVKKLSKSVQKLGDKISVVQVLRLPLEHKIFLGKRAMMDEGDVAKWIKVGAKNLIVDEDTQKSLVDRKKELGEWEKELKKRGEEVDKNMDDAIKGRLEAAAIEKEKLVREEMRLGLDAEMEQRVNAEMEQRVNAEMEQRVNAEMEQRVNAEMEQRVNAEMERRMAFLGMHSR